MDNDTRTPVVDPLKQIAKKRSFVLPLLALLVNLVAALLPGAPAVIIQLISVGSYLIVGVVIFDMTVEKAFAAWLARPPTVKDQLYSALDGYFSGEDDEDDSL